MITERQRWSVRSNRCTSGRMRAPRCSVWSANARWRARSPLSKGAAAGREAPHQLQRLARHHNLSQPRRQANSHLRHNSPPRPLEGKSHPHSPQQQQQWNAPRRPEERQRRNAPRRLEERECARVRVRNMARTARLWNSHQTHSRALEENLEMRNKKY